MPYPNEHSCRINNPDKYVRIIRKNDVQPNVIIGYLPNGKSEVQAYRFPTDKWDEKKAKMFCHQKGGTFEPALKKGDEPMDNYEIVLGENKEKWYLVIPRGVYQHPEYGELNFNDNFFNEMLGNFQNNVLGNTKPFIDQDHDQRGAAGWVNDLKADDKGLWAKIEWTPVGEELIKNKIYRYFSPTIGDYTDPKTGRVYHNVFRGGALTNIPFLKELPEIELKEGKKREINIKILKEGANKMNELIEFLKEKLGVDEIKEDEAMSKLNEYFDKLEKERDEYKGKVEELDEQIKELNKKIEELSEKKDGKGDKEMKEKDEQIKELKERVVNLEMEKVIGQALSEGKILPEKKEFWQKQFRKDPEATKEILENLPKVIEFKEKGTTRTRDHEKIELSEDEKEALNIFGLTEDDYKKYGE